MGWAAADLLERKPHNAVADKSRERAAPVAATRAQDAATA